MNEHQMLDRQNELDDSHLEAVTGGKSGGSGGGSGNVMDSIERYQRYSRNSAINNALYMNSLGINPSSSSFDRLRNRGVDLSALGMD